MTDKTELDKKTYEAAKSYLAEASKHLARAGHKLRDLSEFALEKFGDEFQPYLEQFHRDIREERINLKELGASVKGAFLGEYVSASEREHRIREAAYLHAEMRGFTGGSDIEDWLYAERLVDRQIAEQAGLLEKGRKGIISVTAAAEKELAEVGHAVLDWLENRNAPSGKGKTAAKKAASPRAVKKKAAKKQAPTTAKAAPKKAKNTAKKKATAKKAVKKKTVKKKTAKKS